MEFKSEILGISHRQQCGLNITDVKKWKLICPLCERTAFFYVPDFWTDTQPDPFKEMDLAMEKHLLAKHPDEYAEHKDVFSYCSDT